MTVGYPVLLRLEGRICAIVGGGRVAARKAGDLLDTGARITVISPELSQPLEELAERGRITVRRAVYAAGTLAGLRLFLVFAATNSRAVNRQIVDEARSIGALVDTVDSGNKRDFTSMAAFRRGSLTIAISTGGGSPALAAHLRKRLEAVIGPEYATLADWLGEFRPLVREQVRSEAAREALWQAMIDSPELELLKRDDQAAARQLVEKLLAEAVEKAGRSSPPTDPLK